MPACLPLKDFIWNFGTFLVKPAGAFVTLCHVVINICFISIIPWQTANTVQHKRYRLWLSSAQRFALNVILRKRCQFPFVHDGNESSAPATSPDCMLLYSDLHCSISWLQELRRMDHSLSHFSAAAQALHAP